MIPDPVRALFNPRRGVSRVAVKVGVIALTLMAVLYPRPDLLVKNIRHWRNLDALIDPGSPALDALEAELLPRLVGVAAVGGRSGGGGGPETLRIVEQYVVERIPYAWDWETWGVVDYVPTVEEVIAAGREDCDGRAVVAASLLKRMGYEAKLMSDLSHVWVWTPAGQTMSPVPTASGRTVIAPAEKGSKIDWGALFGWAGIVKDVPTSLAYGVAVFPLWREAIVVLVGCVALAGRRARVGWEVTGAVLIVAGLMVIRWTCADPWARDVAGAWTGIGLGAAGIGVMLWTAGWGRGASMEGVGERVAAEAVEASSALVR